MDQTAFLRPMQMMQQTRPSGEAMTPTLPLIPAAPGVCQPHEMLYYHVLTKCMPKYLRFSSAHSQHMILTACGCLLSSCPPVSPFTFVIKTFLQPGNATTRLEQVVSKVRRTFCPSRSPALPRLSLLASCSLIQDELDSSIEWALLILPVRVDLTKVSSSHPCLQETTDLTFSRLFNITNILHMRDGCWESAPGQPAVLMRL